MYRISMQRVRRHSLVVRRDTIRSIRSCWGRRVLLWSFLTLLSLSPMASGAWAASDPVSKVTFDNQGDWLTVRIATAGTWAHWTLGNPPRIIVDVTDAVSTLPNAPGLYEQKLTTGPVRRVRTSQFSNTSQDRRVRLTLELADVTPYEAERVGNEIHVRVKNSGLTSPSWALGESVPKSSTSSPAPSTPAQEASSESRDRAERASGNPSDDASSDVLGEASDDAASEFVDIQQLRKLLADSIANNSSDEEEPPAKSPSPAKKSQKPVVQKPKIEKPTIKKPAPVARAEKPTDVKEPTGEVAPQKKDLASVSDDMHDRIAAAMKGLADPAEKTTGDSASEESPEKNEPEDSSLSTALASAFDPITDPAPVPRLPKDTREPDLADSKSDDGATIPSEGATSEDDEAGDDEAGDDEADDDPAGNDLAEHDPKDDFGDDSATDDPIGDDQTDVAESDSSSPSKDDFAAAASDDRSEEEKISGAKSRLEDLLGPNSDDFDLDEPAKIDEPSVAGIDDLPESWDQDEDPEAEDTPFDPNEMHSKRASLLLAEAVENWIDGDIESAETRADRIHRYYPETPAGHQAGLMLSEIHYLDNDEGMAEAVDPRSDQPDPEVLPLEYFSTLLENLWVEGRFEHLETRLLEWRDLYPREEWYADFHYRLGTRAYRLRDVEMAQKHLSLVPEGNSREPKSLLMRARLLDETDEKGAALTLYQALAAMTPHGYARRGLSRSADLNFQLGQVEEAYRLYQKVRAQYPTADEDAWALYQLGNCQVQLGDSDSAQLAYAELVSEMSGSYWFEFAEERLNSLSWSGDLARRMEELSQP